MEMISSELEHLKLKNEEETIIRIKFEQKVNSLHALHRELEEKYKRACREIADLE